MLNKRAIAILGAIFLLIVGTLGFLIYQKRSAKQATTPPATVADTTNQDSTPPAADDTNQDQTPVPDVVGGAVKLTDDQVISPALFFQGNGITYFTSTGQVFQSDLQNSSGKWFLNNKKELTITQKSGIHKILWPDSGINFIAELQNNGNRTWSFFDGNRNSFVGLPSKITSISFMPGGQKIAYVWFDKNKSTLYTANGDNTGFQKVADLWENDDEISVAPNGQSILYYERNGNPSKNPIVMVTIDGKVFRSIVKDGYNLGVLWSPDSNKFLFGRKDTSSGLYQLWLANISSGEIKNLGITSSPDKAIWSPDSQSVYAGAAGSSGDQLVKINIGTGESKQYDLKISAQMADLFLSSGGAQLFFRNAQDGGLYYFDLNQQ